MTCRCQGIGYSVNSLIEKKIGYETNSERVKRPDEHTHVHSHEDKERAIQPNLNGEVETPMLNVFEEAHTRGSLPLKLYGPIIEQQHIDNERINKLIKPILINNNIDPDSGKYILGKFGIRRLEPLSVNDEEVKRAEVEMEDLISKFEGLSITEKHAETAEVDVNTSSPQNGANLDINNNQTAVLVQNTNITAEKTRKSNMEGMKEVNLPRRSERIKEKQKREEMLI